MMLMFSTIICLRVLVALVRYKLLIDLHFQRKLAERSSPFPLIGSAMGGMKIFNDAIEALRVSYKKMNPFCVPFATTNMGSAMLAMDLGWMGPNYSISTACATSNLCILNSANHIIRGEAISALWDFFCFNISGTTAVQSCGALSILCMASKSSSTVLSSHLQDIIDIGFGRWAKIEPLLARTGCVALQRLCEDDRKKLFSSNGSRVFGILESLVTGFWLPENIWYAAAYEGIVVLHKIHPTLETFAATLVKKSLRSVFDCSGGEKLQNEIDSAWNSYHCSGGKTL